MEKQIVVRDDIRIAVINSDEALIYDGQSALDLLISLAYNDRCERIVLNKESLTEEFFTLSSGVAGEILQKLVNYTVKLAVYGDFSEYDSKPLKDFIYECNNGRDFFFSATKEEALEKLSMTQ